MRVLRLLGALLLVAAWAAPGAVAGEALVRVQALPNPDGYPQGGEHALTLRLTIAPGYHINSRKPNDSYLIPTRLACRSPRGVRLSGLAFPPPEVVKFGFMDKPASVYSGEILVRGALTAAPDAPPGRREITCRLSYQGCNQKACLMPEEISFAIPIKVTPAGRPGR